jgi:hypothetical protein
LFAEKWRVKHKETGKVFVAKIFGERMTWNFKVELSALE